jgi:putative MATE family efflux protein
VSVEAFSQATRADKDDAIADVARGGGLVARPRPIWKLVLLLALPVLGQQYLVLAVGLSDRFLAGNFNPVGPAQEAEALGHRLLALGLPAGNLAAQGWAGALAAEAHWEAARQLSAVQVSYQAAQTTANYLAWVIASYTVLVSAGSTALVARFIGAGDRVAAVHATNQSVVLGVLFGLAGTGAGLVGLEWLVGLLQLRGEAAVFAGQYLTPMFVLLVFQVVEAAGIACLIGAGDTMTGMLVRAGVAVVNVPLAWGLCLGLGPLPKLGFAGISLGTALSNVLGCTAVLAVLCRGRAGLRLDPRQLWPDFRMLYRLLRISLPAGVDSLSVVMGQLWFLSIVNRLGDVASGAHGIAIGWEALGYLSGGAFGTAAMALVGQYLGAGQPARAARSGWVAFGLGCGMMCAMGAVFFLLAPQMFAVFCPHPEQRPIIDVGVPVLRLVAFAMPAAASCIVLTYALRGAGDTRVPVLFTWVGFLGFRIPLAYFLTQSRVDLGALGVWPGWDLGLFGAWLAMFADLMVRGVFFLCRFAGGRWQKIEV